MKQIQPKYINIPKKLIRSLIFTSKVTVLLHAKYGGDTNGSLGLNLLHTTPFGVAIAGTVPEHVRDSWECSITQFGLALTAVSPWVEN